MGKGDRTTTPMGYVELDTGRHVDEQGNEIPAGLDQGTIDQLAKLAGPRAATLVGNQADLQVHGAELAASSDKNGHESGSAPVVVKSGPQVPPLVQPEILEPGEDLEIAAENLQEVAKEVKEDAKETKKK